MHVQVLRPIEGALQIRPREVYMRFGVELVYTRGASHRAGFRDILHGPQGWNGADTNGGVLPDTVNSDARVGLQGARESVH